jgi:phosphonopyruvate decarboxylase
MIGLGLALARPDKRILVVTGDGELLMNVSALATSE